MATVEGAPGSADVQRSPLALLASEADELAVLSEHLCRHADALGVHEGRPLEVIEAGCGRRWQLDLGGRPIRLLGIDRDADAVDLRCRLEGDLDEAVVGDLRTVAIEPASADAVTSSFVLEHIAGAEAVLDRFLTWVRPGGLVLLRIPDRDSVYGWVTRHTPHAAHVAFRRHVIGMPGAGTNGHGPYPTVYDPVVSRRGIHRWAAARGVTVVAEHGSSVYLTRAGRLGRPMALAVHAVAGASRGRLAGDHNNLLFVLRAPLDGGEAEPPRSSDSTGARSPATRL